MLNVDVSRVVFVVLASWLDIYRFFAVNFLYVVFKQIQRPETSVLLTTIIYIYMKKHNAMRKKRAL